ncbi:putative ABC transport system permease protein [Lachnospiraceae bacterium C7]|nr:putative ABC transport system permease protein [Lachnospiraceae bacterium C7]
MFNPINKRVFRKIKHNIGKYIALFLFMTLFIGFISGFLVADKSMIHTYMESFHKYNVENGNFTYSQKINSKEKNIIEKENNIKIYNLFYKDVCVGKKQNRINKSNILRIYKDRKKVNKICMMSGEMPKNKNEVALDRMYATNNKFKVGDKIFLNKKEYKISGFVAFPDYSTLFKENSDMMFDANLFGVGIVNSEAYEEINSNEIYKYSYIYTYKNKTKTKNNLSNAIENEVIEKKTSDKIGENLVKHGNVQEYIPRYLNKAIKFAGDDMGKDGVMMEVILYMIIAIIAFIFAVTADNTVVSEAKVIGTLRALGYSKKEIISHYMLTPVIITIISAIVGNMFGYTVFEKVAASMYYGSYSLLKYTTTLNAVAFIKTTIITTMIVIIINYFMLNRKIYLAPIKFLRGDLSKHKNKKHAKLKHFSFITRFRIRILSQNAKSYIIMFVGICLANVFLFFGFVLSPLLENYQTSILDNMISKYQVYINMPEETKTPGVEKFMFTTLSNIPNDRIIQEDISIYGINKKSDYVNLTLDDDEIYISDGIAKKYQLKKGDTIQLKEKYTKKKYSFKIDGIYNYPVSQSIFMNKATFANKFKVDKTSFNGYFSNKKITDLNKQNVITVIDKNDLTKVTRQLKTSMGDLFYLVDAFAVVMFALVIYLLAKLSVERNSNIISMLKILGYSNSETKKLFLIASRIVVFISVFVSVPLTYYIVFAIYRPMIKKMMSGWMPFDVPIIVFVEMIVLGIITYFLTEAVVYKKVREIPMELALKNIE